MVPDTIKKYILKNPYSYIIPKIVQEEECQDQVLKS